MANIKSFYLSDPGKQRDNNEDAAGSFEPTDPIQLQQSGRLYVIADGLGGHQMGEKASAYAVQTLLKRYYETPEVPPEERLRENIQRIHQDIFSDAQKILAPGEKMATTIVAAVIRENSLQIAHVGDSRAYLIRDRYVQQITNDHSYVGGLLRAGTLTEEEARQSPFRNRLTRSVGGNEPVPEVDVSSPIQLHAGDIILLCTDGLTQYLTPQDLLSIIANREAREIAEQLIQFANSQGGSDNVTASVIMYEMVPAAAPALVPVAPPKRIWPMVGIAALLAITLVAVLGWLRYRGGPLPSTATATAVASTPAQLASPTATATPTSVLTQTVTTTSTSTPTSTSTSTPIPLPTSTSPKQDVPDVLTKIGPFPTFLPFP